MLTRFLLVFYKQNLLFQSLLPVPSPMAISTMTNLSPILSHLYAVAPSSTGNQVNGVIYSHANTRPSSHLLYPPQNNSHLMSQLRQPLFSPMQAAVANSSNQHAMPPSQPPPRPLQTALPATASATNSTNSRGGTTSRRSPTRRANASASAASGSAPSREKSKSCEKYIHVYPNPAGDNYTIIRLTGVTDDLKVEFLKPYCETQIRPNGHMVMLRTSALGKVETTPPPPARRN